MQDVETRSTRLLAMWRAAPAALQIGELVTKRTPIISGEELMGGGRQLLHHPSLAPPLALHHLADMRIACNASRATPRALCFARHLLLLCLRPLFVRDDVMTDD